MRTSTERYTSLDVVLPPKGKRHWSPDVKARIVGKS